MTNESETVVSDNNVAGGLSLGFAIAAIVVYLVCMFLMLSIESGKIPDQEYETNDPSIIMDPALNGLSFVGQIIVFGVGGLIGGTLSVCSIVAGLFGLAKDQKFTASAGLVLSVGPLLLIYGYLMWISRGF